MAAATTFRFNERGMAATFQSWNGPIGHDLFRRASKVQIAAKRQVGKDTHRLERSITKRQDRDETRPGAGLKGDLVMRVGSFDNWFMNRVGTDHGAEADYSLMHHEGTRPHAIVPRHPNGVLRFMKDGKVVFARRVWHPGTRPNRYLSDNLHLAVD